MPDSITFEAPIDLRGDESLDSSLVGTVAEFMREGKRCVVLSSGSRAAWRFMDQIAALFPEGVVKRNRECTKLGNGGSCHAMPSSVVGLRGACFDCIFIERTAEESVFNDVVVPCLGVRGTKAFITDSDLCRTQGLISPDGHAC